MMFWCGLGCGANEILPNSGGHAFCGHFVERTEQMRARVNYAGAWLSKPPLGPYGSSRTAARSALPYSIFRPRMHVVGLTDEIDERSTTVHELKTHGKTGVWL